MNEILKGATISPCQKYRYELYRKWGKGNKAVAFIGLNPSTADARQDDPTVRRCIGFAQDWGFDSLTIFNLFAFRATDPQEMKKAKDPIGPDNDDFLRSLFEEHELAVAMWGRHGSFLNRDKEVKSFLSDLFCIKINRDGSPAHPLYLKSELKPRRWFI